jgi:parvulin-like peptidyl-prolyl isomerase
LTKAEFEELVRSRPVFEGQVQNPAQKRSLGLHFARAFALEGEARRRKIDQNPRVKLQIRSVVQQILAAELLAQLRADYRKDEQALRRRYDASRDMYSEPKVRHILIRTKGSAAAARPGVRELSDDEARQKAAQLLSQLKAGADFARLAHDHSDDIATRQNGGQIGIIHRGSMDARFENAAYTIAVGQVSEPVRTQFGYHLIRVDSREAQPFESVRDVVANDLAHQEIDRILAGGFKMNEEYFGKQ